MFSAAGNADPRFPRAPRVPTIDGTPCRLPINPDSAIGVFPIKCPSNTIPSPAASPNGASIPPAQISESEIAAPAHSRK